MYYYHFQLSVILVGVAFSALTLLVGCEEDHLTRKTI